MLLKRELREDLSSHLIALLLLCCTVQLSYGQGNVPIFNVAIFNVLLTNVDYQQRFKLY